MSEQKINEKKLEKVDGGFVSHLELIGTGTDGLILYRRKCADCGELFAESYPSGKCSKCGGQIIPCCIYR